jgi:hypothetical protein
MRLAEATPMKKTQVALILVGIAALALGGTALAAKGHSQNTRAASAARGDDHHGPGDDLAAAASYLGSTTDALLTQLKAGKTLAQIADATSGKSKAGLIAALVSHEKQELADAVTAGRLTKAQSDQIASTLTQRFTDLVNGVRPAIGPGGRGPGHDHGEGIQVAATYLGITVDSLRTQLQAGKTLAQVANATSGKSASGLIDALVADATTRFGANAPSDLKQRITDLVNGTAPRLGLGPRGGHGHWDGGGAPGPRERSF